jgi:hypothetical protein
VSAAGRRERGSAGSRHTAGGVAATFRCKQRRRWGWGGVSRVGGGLLKADRGQWTNIDCRVCGQTSVEWRKKVTLRANFSVY